MSRAQPASSRSPQQQPQCGCRRHAVLRPAPGPAPGSPSLTRSTAGRRRRTRPRRATAHATPSSSAPGRAGAGRPCGSGPGDTCWRSTTPRRSSRSPRWASTHRRQAVRPGTTNGPTRTAPPLAVSSRCGRPVRSGVVERVPVRLAGAEHDGHGRGRLGVRDAADARAAEEVAGRRRPGRHRRASRSSDTVARRRAVEPVRGGRAVLREGRGHRALGEAGRPGPRPTAPRTTAARSTTSPRAARAPTTSESGESAARSARVAGESRAAAAGRARAPPGGWGRRGGRPADRRRSIGTRAPVSGSMPAHVAQGDRS